MGHVIVQFLVFLRSIHTVSHTDSTNLHSQQRFLRVPFSPRPLQCLLFVFHLMLAVLTGMS